ncbi:MAG: extracellular solute-binding protein [Treponema sp.]|jgi:putative aldouronate transport system substrate-binding protein|nr:extracellular solute-binding protein [Treponema sp.]
MMKKTVLLMASLVLTLMPFFTGCSRAKGGASERSEGDVATTTSLDSYPIKTDVTLTYWGELSGSVAANYTNLGETPYGKAWIEKTGVKVEFLHPPAGGANEQFNLLVASGDMPDIMDRDWLNLYPGGPEKAINDSVILKLNDIIDKYSPNLKQVLDSHPDWARMVKTDNGNYYGYPFIRGNEKLCIWHGPYVRKDWLEELNMEVPQTFDEWHEMLTVFKEKKRSPAPMVMMITNNDFLLGYGIDRAFFVGDDGKVHWGSMEDAFRDYLTMMARWYKEGLLDPDIATLTSQQISAKVTGNISGATRGSLGGSLGTWTNSARATNPKFELTAVPYPVKKKGDKPKLINVDNLYTGGFSAGITTSCENPDIAARLLDYNYGEEGYIFNNFGIEGVSYTMVNGRPIYTDFIMKNPNGWSVAQSIASHARSAYGGPFIQDLGYFEQYMALPEQKAGPDIWKIDAPYKHKLPPITPTPEESREFARIMSEVNTYADEMMVKFILGTEAITDASWNAYVNTIKRMGIARAVEIQNAALARYNAR